MAVPVARRRTTVAERSVDEIAGALAGLVKCLGASSKFTISVSDVLPLLADRDALKAKLERAREALTPFAEAADSYDPDEGDGGYGAWQHEFRICSLRRARAALAEIEAPETTKPAPAPVKDAEAE